MHTKFIESILRPNDVQIDFFKYNPKKKKITSFHSYFFKLQFSSLSTQIISIISRYSKLFIKNYKTNVSGGNFYYYVNL